MSPSSHNNNKSWIPTLLLGAAAAAVTVGLVAYNKSVTQRQSSKTNKSNKLQSSTTTLDHIQEAGNKNGNNSNASEEALVTARFQKCVELMGPQLKMLSQQQQLNYYGLFKQATLGNAGEYMPAPPPSYDMVASAKYSAWQKRHGMTRLAAMQEYIDVVITYEYTKSIIGNDDDDDNYELEGDAVMDVMSMGNKPSTLAAAGSDSFYDCIEGDDDGDNNGTTTSTKYPLHAAAREGRLEGLQALLSNSNDDDNSAAAAMDVDPNELDPAGQTPLHLAADQGHLECMKVLILHKADIHAVDTEGISILHVAVIAGTVDCCRLLLALGCDPKQPDHDGETPWDAAQDEPELQKLLKEHETSPILLEDSVFEQALRQRGISISPTTTTDAIPKVESAVDMQKEMKKLDSPMDLDLDDDGDM